MEIIEGTKKVNKKKIIITIIILIFIISLIVSFAVYISYKPFRDLVDQYVLRKNITSENTQIIEIDTKSNQHICSYGNYIAIVEGRKFTTYNSSGKKETELEVEVTEPITEANNNYIVLAEKNGKKVYLIEDKKIVWDKELEGNIVRIHVNENGYTAIIIRGTTYKSIIQVFDNTGKELFKTYLSSTIATDVSISKDNKYVSFAEINVSGTLIESSIKTISVEKTKENAQDSIIYTYKAENNKLILRIKYQDKNSLVCMYDDSIDLLQGETNKILYDIQEASFADIELKNFIVRITENKSGIFKTTNLVEFKNVSTDKENLCTIEGAIKNIYTNGETVAINLGNEIQFIGTNGWLIKRYITTQEPKDIIIGNGIAGLIYKDKIEIINL